MLALELSRESIEAEEVLRRRGGSLPARVVFDLTLLATGSREQAEAAFRARRHAELRSGQTPT